MKRNSPQSVELARARILAAVLGGCALSMAASAGTAGVAQQAAFPIQERQVVLDVAGASPRPEAAGRPIILTVPAKDGATYLGDIIVTIRPQGSIAFSAQRLLDLLGSALDPAVLRTLESSFAGRTILHPEDFQASGIRVRYDPQAVALELDIAAERRVTRTVQVSPLDHVVGGNFASPADYSGYLNIRGNLDYVRADGHRALRAPLLFLDGAVRIQGIVAEAEAIWQNDALGADFQRLGSRLVYDDRDRLVRWTAGDLQPLARGLQSTPDIAGISVFRSYSLLQPQTLAQPRGDRSFRLDRPSTVEIQVNGQIVRRLQLPAGTYNLRDFPFTQGSNDIRMTVTDDTGRSENLRFNVFLDQSQLAAGLSEFGFYAGVSAPMGMRGPHYSGHPAMTGFYRLGVNDAVTVGANFQADRNSRLAGLEALVGTPLGMLGVNLAASSIANRSIGLGTVITLQRLIERRGGRSDSINLSIETRTRDFGPMGSTHPENPFRWEAGGGYAHAFSESVYAGLDGRYSHGRGTQRDFQTVTASFGWRINRGLSMTGNTRYERTADGPRVAALLSLTVQLGRYSNIQTDYDARDDRMRIAYQTLHGQGVGSYNVAAGVERTDSGSTTNFTGNYITNRGELGLTYFGTGSEGFGRTTTQRTSLRFATSLALADGAFSIGRPITDSFAIVRGHRSLKGEPILIDSSPYGYAANTGLLGTATRAGLNSYSERTLVVDVPSAPAGVDFGEGAFRLFPPYRGGYRLTVGSDYNITALGRLLDQDGGPIGLVSGTAVELAHPDRQPIILFTNREGRFGINGLAPGRWQVRMLDEHKAAFMIDVPKAAEGVLKLGDIRVADGSE